MIQSLILLASLISAVWAQTASSVNWQRVVALREKAVRGNALSEEEQAELTAALSRLDPRTQSAIATRLALAGLAGDGADDVFAAPPVQIPLDVSPVGLIAATASDGAQVEASFRRPAAPGPFPVVIIIHGGLHSQRPERRDLALTTGPVHTRLLAAGYLVVQATFRSYRQDNLLAPGPLLDIEAIYKKVRSLKEADPRRIALFGGSGGGSLALDLAARQQPAAVIVGEPATILFAGMLRTGDYQVRLRMMGDPQSYYLKEQEQLMGSKLGRIRSPILYLAGDVHPLRIMNQEIFLPAARKAGVEVQARVYPGEGHGFYFGSATSPATVERVVADIRAFLTQHFSATRGGRP